MKLLADISHYDNVANISHHEIMANISYHHTVSNNSHHDIVVIMFILHLWLTFLIIKL